MSESGREVDAVRFVDERLGAAAFARKALRYVFPEHWSFLLGEVALYSFVFLVLSGTFLAFFFTPDVGSHATYHGMFQELQGFSVTPAYDSVLGLSSTVPAGLLMRQAHHWAALIFVVAMVAHLARTFFTGAFRRPREVIWMLGVLLLGAGIFEGFAGYSLPDDLLSGMGLAIAYGVALSLPLLGGSVGALAWGGQLPGDGSIESRLFIAHVFLVPALMAALITIHLALVVRHHHTQFGGPGRREGNVVGAPMWPGYALRSLGLMLLVFAVLVALGGLVQINPIWQWGPYELDRATNGAQPDWYLGWLIGGLRIMPPLEIRAFGRTLVPNPFWGGALFPTVVFGYLLAHPWIEQRLTRGRAREHHLLDRPRDHAWRTAFGAAFLTWVGSIFFAGSSDRLFYAVGIDYQAQVHVYRVLVFVLPLVVFAATKAICHELRRTRVAPLRGGPPQPVHRRDGGGFELVEGLARPSPSDEREAG
jgi:ubiquinol-cytochrome c reductase cytochrome b subunit